MALSEIETNIYDFIVTELLYEKDLHNLGVADHLLGEGMLDSLGIMRIVSFCEETFGVQIPDEEIVPEHFENIQAIAALVQGQLAPK